MAIITRPIGYSGMDLYAYDDTTKRWGYVRTSFSGLAFPSSVFDPLATGLPATSRKYRVHLPMYASIDSVSVGVPVSCSFKPDVSYKATKPVVWYGTR